MYVQLALSFLLISHFAHADTPSEAEVIELFDKYQQLSHGDYQSKPSDVFSKKLIDDQGGEEALKERFQRVAPPISAALVEEREENLLPQMENPDQWVHSMRGVKQTKRKSTTKSYQHDIKASQLDENHAYLRRVDLESGEAEDITYILKKENQRWVIEDTLHREE